ncbi:hypothetical protein KDH_57130 [Dictyobacter sp. S3.2.2.5]|uniref:Uncharacterized protein n=1 Tax=Dictyobacter halimunensis TaxID=3026934 RepID=A0ABQ6FX84_9CHLR|nr:hypothetical protein KDH_57130 [Dictyobacter sp. S3.2.2.5]
MLVHRVRECAPDAPTYKNERGCAADARAGALTYLQGDKSKTYSANRMPPEKKACHSNQQV